MNIQMGLFSYRTMSSINSSYDITGPITKCHNGSLSLKLVHLWFLKIFLLVFIFSLRLMNMKKSKSTNLPLVKKGYVKALK